jgi:hypothetical protein
MRGNNRKISVIGLGVMNLKFCLFNLLDAQALTCRNVAKMSSATGPNRCLQ